MYRFVVDGSGRAGFVTREHLINYINTAEEQLGLSKTDEPQKGFLNPDSYEDSLKNAYGCKSALLRNYHYKKLANKPEKDALLMRLEKIIKRHEALIKAKKEKVRILPPDLFSGDMFSPDMAEIGQYVEAQRMATALLLDSVVREEEKTKQALEGAQPSRIEVLSDSEEEKEEKKRKKRKKRNRKKNPPARGGIVEAPPSRKGERGLEVKKKKHPSGAGSSSTTKGMLQDFAPSSKAIAVIRPEPNIPELCKMMLKRVETEEPNEALYNDLLSAIQESERLKKRTVTNYLKSLLSDLFFKQGMIYHCRKAFPDAAVMLAEAVHLSEEVSSAFMCLSILAPDDPAVANGLTLSQINVSTYQEALDRVRALIKRYQRFHDPDRVAAIKAAGKWETGKPVSQQKFPHRDFVLGRYSSEIERLQWRLGVAQEELEEQVWPLIGL
jgi:hypothetical protein